MSLNVYRVTDDTGRTHMRVEAKSPAAAKKAFADSLVIEKLTTREIVEATQRGYAVLSAETGSVIDAAAADQQDDLPWREP